MNKLARSSVVELLYVDPPHVSYGEERKNLLPQFRWRASRFSVVLNWIPSLASSDNVGVNRIYVISRRKTSRSNSVALRPQRADTTVMRVEQKFGQI